MSFLVRYFIYCVCTVYTMCAWRSEDSVCESTVLSPGFPGVNSGHEAWQQAPPPAEPSHGFKAFCLDPPSLSLCWSISPGIPGSRASQTSDSLIHLDFTTSLQDCFINLSILNVQLNSLFKLKYGVGSLNHIR